MHPGCIGEMNKDRKIQLSAKTGLPIGGFDDEKADEHDDDDDDDAADFDV